MSRNGYRTILYVLALLLIASGVLLFLGRDQLLEYVRQKSDLEQLPETKSIGTSTPKESLETDILKTAKFKALKNNVIKFDFDNICARPGETAAKIPVSLENATTTEASSSPKVFNCAVGSSNLFFIKNN